MGHELPEERPDRRDPGGDATREAGAQGARSTPGPPRGGGAFGDAQRRQVLEQRAVAPAVDGCVDPFGCEAMVSDGGHDDRKASSWYAVSSALSSARKCLASIAVPRTSPAHGRQTSSTLR